MALTSATLANLRTELRARLGYAAVADTSGPMQTLLNSFLIEAHEQLSIQLEASEDRRDWILPLVPGQTIYQLPTDDCGYTPDHERILGVFVGTSGQWSHLRRGIDPVCYTTASRGIPTRYDIAHGNANPELQPPGLVSP